MSTGNGIVDKARATSVEYWQKIANDLSVENEELRKQLGLLQQPNTVAVQEVLTHLLVEKVKDVSLLESIIDTPTHGKLEEGLEILRAFRSSGFIISLLIGRFFRSMLLSATRVSWHFHID